MKKSKFTESQIAFAIKQAESGTKVEEVCRQMGISSASFKVKKEGNGLSVALFFVSPQLYAAQFFNNCLKLQQEVKVGDGHSNCV